MKGLGVSGHARTSASRRATGEAFSPRLSIASIAGSVANVIWSNVASSEEELPPESESCLLDAAPSDAPPSTVLFPVGIGTVARRSVQTVEDWRRRLPPGPGAPTEKSVPGGQKPCSTARWESMALGSMGCSQSQKFEVPASMASRVTCNSSTKGSGTTRPCLSCMLRSEVATPTSSYEAIVAAISFETWLLHCTCAVELPLDWHAADSMGTFGSETFTVGGAVDTAPKGKREVSTITLMLRMAMQHTRAQ